MGRRILCIYRDKGIYENPFESILHLGWMEDHTRKTGRSTRTAFQEWIATGGYAYVRDIDGNDIHVVNIINHAGIKCLGTVLGNAETDPLLKLIECR